MTSTLRLQKKFVTKEERMLTSMFDFEIDEAALSKQSCSSKRSMTMVEKWKNLEQLLRYLVIDVLDELI